MLQPFFALSHGFDGLLVLGGVPERCDDTRIYNTLLVLQRGCIVASYRKIHRFDATLSDGSVYRESEVTAAGHDPIVLETPFARLGLSICYDLRFPEHFRALASAGAEVMLVPSAFTVPTGRAHWEVLLRARAIEAQAFVLAPAQYGDHGHGRTSFGHTMAIDPWGRVLACQPAGEAVLHVDLQARVLDETRAALPTHAHHVLSPETSARVVTLPADAFPRRTPP